MTQLLGGIEARTSKPARRRPRYNPYAACVVRFGPDGTLYLNAGIPIGHHPSEGLCPRCKHAYSHMIDAGIERCRECELERIAAVAKELEQAGINLGWGTHEHSSEYVRESHQTYRAR